MQGEEQGRTYSLRSSPAFIFRDFLDSALDFDQVERLGAQLYHAGEDRLDFCELVLVARDEVQVLGHRGRRRSSLLCRHFAVVYVLDAWNWWILSKESDDLNLLVPEGSSIFNPIAISYRYR